MSGHYRVLLTFTGITLLFVAIALITHPSKPSILDDSSSNPEQTRIEETSQASYSLAEGLRVSRNRITETQRDSGETDKGERNPYSLASADLLAQERVAHWTFWIGLFTAAGLVALLWTIFETVQMTQATREIGEKQVRAYLTFEIESLPKRLNITKQPQFRFNIKNTGQSPALNVRVQTGVNAYNGEEIPADIKAVFPDDGKETADAAIVAPGETQATEVFCEDTPYELECHSPKLDKYLLICRVVYKDVFKKQDRQTVSCFLGTIVDFKIKGDDQFAVIDWSSHSQLQDAT